MQDGRVREEHQELDGVIKPVGSKFWDMYYPPNGWNCRCRIVQHANGPATTQRKFPPVDSPIFAQNVGKTGQIFPTIGPATHPYFKKKSPAIKRELKKKAAESEASAMIPVKLKTDFPQLTGPEFEPLFSKFRKRVDVQRGVDSWYRLSRGGFKDPFNPNINKIQVATGYRTDPKRKPKTWFKSAVHELGHALDHQIGFQVGEKWKPIASKLEALRKKRGDTRFSRELDRALGSAKSDRYGLEFDDFGAEVWSEISSGANDFKYLKKTPEYKALPNWFKDGIAVAEKEGFSVGDFWEVWGGWADTYGAATKGKIGRGHSFSYFNDLNRGPSEIFAHIVEMRFVPGWKEIIRAWDPDFVKLMETHAKEIFD